jgi:hypothetical protein
VHPYRSPVSNARAPTRDASFAWVAATVWAGSVLRAVVAYAAREPFGEEVAMAIVLAVALPLIVRRGISVDHGGAAES